MAVTMIPVQLPESLYQRLQNIATVAHRSVDEIVASAIAVAVPAAPDLPETLANELAEMIWLSDDALHTAIQPTFTLHQQTRLAELNALNDERSLSLAEKREQEKLLAAYERSVLRRAQAFAILARRGHQTPTHAELTHTP